MQFALNESKKKQGRLFQLSTETQVGVFSLKFTKIRLAPGFIDRINLLPDSYSFPAYKQFALDYGTHYFAQGRMGGRFRMIYSFTREQLAQSVTQESEQTDCLKIEGRVSLGFAKFASFEGSGKYDKCEERSTNVGRDASFSALRENVRGFIEGGESAQVGKLQGGIIFSKSQPEGLKSDYESWVETIRTNPIMLSYELRSIHTLLDSSLLHPDTIAQLNNVDAKRNHLAKALKVYYEAETKFDWDASSCPSCQGDVNAVSAVYDRVADSDTKSCACKCRDATVKYTCEATPRPPVYTSAEVATTAPGTTGWVYTTAGPWGFTTA